MEEVAKDLKISKSTISKWVNSVKDNNGTVQHGGSGNYSSKIKKRIKGFKGYAEILKKAIGILND